MTGDAWLEVTATNPEGDEVVVGTHDQIAPAMRLWRSLLGDHAWIGAVRIWLCTDAGREVVACSTVDGDGLTPFGKVVARDAGLLADTPPVAYRVEVDDAPAGAWHVVARPLGGDPRLLRAVLEVAAGRWSLRVQPVTDDGRPDGPEAIVDGATNDPSFPALALLCGAVPPPSTAGRHSVN